MKGNDASSRAESRRWRLFEHFRQQWAGLLALTLVLGGGTAYAVDGPLAGQNTVGSEDIINGEVKTADIGGSEVTAAKVLDDSLGNVDLKAGSVRASEVANESLTGLDADNGASMRSTSRLFRYPGLMIRSSTRALSESDLGPRGRVPSFCMTPGSIFHLATAKEARRRAVSTTMRTDVSRRQREIRDIVRQPSSLRTNSSRRSSIPRSTGSTGLVLPGPFHAT